MRLAKYSKNSSLLINVLFIELLYQINITFVIMLNLGEKKRPSSCDIDYLYYINISGGHRLIFLI